MNVPRLSDKQLEIMLFTHRTEYQALICDGAVRSGKTSIMTVAFVDWAMREFTSTTFAICGKTVGSAIKNIITPYMALSYAKNKYSISFTRSDNKMIVRRGGRSNTFYVYGGKDESSYMLIQGITLAGVLLDEVALMTQSFVEEALARCLTFPNRRYFFNCNPESPTHWFYREWILQPEKHKVLHLHFLMSDNPALSEETIRQAERDFSGVFYDRKVLGRWVVAEGRVYPMFNNKLHVAPDVARPYEKYWISMDYGIQNATVMQLWGLADGVYYCIGEYYHSGRESNCQKTDEEYYAELEKLAGGLPVEYVIIDPSAASFIVLVMRRKKFRVYAADNNVKEGISECCTALKKGVVAFNGCCRHTIGEFLLYSWDAKAAEDRPVKENDHCMDAFRYFAYSLRITAPEHSAEHKRKEGRRRP